jgi:hypothetical protein
VVVSDGLASATESFVLNVLPPAVTGSYDVDRNGKIEGLLDGILILRYMFGFRGTALTRGAVGNGAQRTTAAEITTYLDGMGLDLDVDGNTKVEPLYDGLLILRYIMGFRGASLIKGVIGPGATRTMPSPIVGFLDQYMTPAKSQPEAKSAAKSAVTTQQTDAAVDLKRLRRPTNRWEKRF